MSTLKRIIAPSLLACDFTELGKEIESVLECGADWLHIDVMDGMFTSNIAIGFPVIRSIRQRFPEAFLDVHLMIHYPSRWLFDLVRAGARQITIHVECELDESLSDTLEKIRHGKGVPTLVGLAVSPDTPYAKIADVVHLCDVILVMTVRPGWGGQALIPETLDKVREIRAKHPTIDIQVDGGINAETAPLAVRAGANVLVAGSALFGLESQTAREDFCKHLKNCS